MEKDAFVGIIANPASGKDIRRLVASAGLGNGEGEHRRRILLALGIGVGRARDADYGSSAGGGRALRPPCASRDTRYAAYRNADRLAARGTSLGRCGCASRGGRDGPDGGEGCRDVPVVHGDEQRLSCSSRTTAGLAAG